MNLEWNVYIVDHNANTIKTWNVFDHYRFVEDLKKDFKKYKDDKDEFLKRLQVSLFYYYGSKFEWEISISDLFGRDTFKPLKTDVRKQILLNWDVFSEYVWNELTKRRRKPKSQTKS